MKYSIALSTILFSLTCITAIAKTADLQVNFYTEKLTLAYDDAMLQARCTGIHERGIASYYRQLDRTPYHLFLEELLDTKQALALNDWLLYELLRDGLRDILVAKTPAERELAAWFFLSKMGFETRIAYLDEQVFLYVRSEDEVFEIPMIEADEKSFVNLSNSSAGARPQGEALYLLNFQPVKDGKSFGFYLSTFPNLEQQPASRTVRFSYRDSLYQLDVQYDKTLVQLMEHYPLIAEQQYLKLPMSSTLTQSLLPQFRQLLKDKSLIESVELLLAFTRSSFEYKEDVALFGRSKPMIPDEVFFYPHSDCEDRSALFFGMVKTLLDLPMIVVAFPDHLTVAVHLDVKLPGAVIEYKENRYYICDPTGPVNSAEIGVFPEKYKNSEFSIISSYK